MDTDTIYELEIETFGGDKTTIDARLEDDWGSITKGTKALMFLANGSMVYIEVIEACIDEGVSFKVIGSESKYVLHYDAHNIIEILVEV